MQVSIEIIRRIMRDTHQALMEKAAQDYQDSPARTIQTIARQSVTMQAEEKIINDFETLAKYYIRIAH